MTPTEISSGAEKSPDEVRKRPASPSNQKSQQERTLVEVSPYRVRNGWYPFGIMFIISFTFFIRSICHLRSGDQCTEKGLYLSPILSTLIVEIIMPYFVARKQYKYVPETPAELSALKKKHRSEDQTFVLFLVGLIVQHYIF